MRTTDMTQQIDQIKNSKKSVGLVVDDASGLDIDFAIKHDIVFVPFKTSWEKVDKKSSYKNLSIYQKMELFKDKTEEYGWPKTSQPTLQSFSNSFKEQLQKYNYVICITASTVISGSYNSAIQARSLLSNEDQKRIIIPDLKQFGPGQSLLTIKAVKLIEQEYTYKQIEKQLMSFTKNIDTFGTPKNIIWITTGGRVNGTIAKIAHFFQKIKIRPMFLLTTKTISLKKIYFGDKPLSTLFVHYLNQKYYSSNGPLKLVIQHGDDSSEFEKIKKMLDPKRFNIVQETILSPVIGIHTGPGTFIIGILKPSKK
jgi:DegV family protein with EDD domain